MLLQLLLNKQEHLSFFIHFSGPNMSHGKHHNYLGHWRTLLSPNPVSHQLFTNTSFLTQKPAHMKLQLQTLHKHTEDTFPKLSQTVVGHIVPCVFMQNFTDVTSLISYKHITSHSGRLLQKAAARVMNKRTLSQML